MIWFTFDFMIFHSILLHGFLFPLQHQHHNRNFLKLQSHAIIATKLWIKHVVIQYELCPWAKNIFLQNKLKLHEVHNCTNNYNLYYDDEKYRNYVYFHDIAVNEAKLLKNDDYPYSSTLVILPDWIIFRDFLKLVNKVGNTLKETKTDDHIQMATFHPKYIFDGTKMNDVENYTNRSPFPIIHFLRIKDVAQAIASYNGKTDIIWKKNIDTMKTMGLEKMEKSLAEILRNSTII
jgi:hypothetical protein